MKRAGLLIAALTLTLAAQSAAAETLSLVCKVHWTKAGGAHREGRRRLDLDLARKTVRVSDDLGKGWQFRREYGYLAADANLIRLESGDGKEASVDRRTGLYSFHNSHDGVTIRGPCEKAAAETPRF